MARKLQNEETIKKIENLITDVFLNTNKKPVTRKKAFTKNNISLQRYHHIGSDYNLSNMINCGMVTKIETQPCRYKWNDETPTNDTDILRKLAIKYYSYVQETIKNYQSNSMRTNKKQQKFNNEENNKTNTLITMKTNIENNNENTELQLVNKKMETTIKNLLKLFTYLREKMKDGAILMKDAARNEDGKLLFEVFHVAAEYKLKLFIKYNFIKEIKIKDDENIYIMWIGGEPTRETILPMCLEVSNHKKENAEKNKQKSNILIDAMDKKLEEAFSSSKDQTNSLNQNDDIDRINKFSNRFNINENEITIDENIFKGKSKDEIIIEIYKKIIIMEKKVDVIYEIEHLNMNWLYIASQLNNQQ